MSSVNEKRLIEQVSTTLEIINSLDLRKKRDKAILLNSMLSLIVLPLEEIKKYNGQRLFNGSYYEVLKKCGISPLIFQIIKTCDGSIISYEKRTVYTFMRAFRNCIAHQNLTVIDDRNAIVFKNKHDFKKCKSCRLKRCTEKGIEYHKNGVFDFVIELNYPQIRKLSQYIATSFLKVCNNGGNN